MKPLLKTFKPGMSLFRENDRSRELYIIQTGKVKVFRKVGTREIELATLGKGAVLGEMALIDGKPRSASAKALEESSVILINADVFHKKIAGVPPWFLSIVRMTSQKIRQANRRLRAITREHQGANSIICLYYLFMHFGNGRELSLQKTKFHLVKLLGSTFQSIERVFDFLYQHEFISIDDDRLELPDKEEMKRYCDFLRMLIRKNFDTLTPIPSPFIPILINITRRYPSVLTQEDTTLGIDPDTFWAEITGMGLEEQCGEIVTEFLQRSLITSQGYESSRITSNPLNGTKLTIHCKNWIRYYTFHKYEKAIPAI